MKKKKSKGNTCKIGLLVLLLINTITILILSYDGLLFFTKGFNDFDFLIFNILGNAILVGIATHISSKNKSLFVSKKDFDRNKKLTLIWLVFKNVTN